MDNGYQDNGNQKTTGVVILKSDKTDFKKVLLLLKNDIA